MKKSFLFTGLFTIIALLYNSWPLGYWLDEATARFGIASDLEDPNHPYSWVFIIFDVLVALIVVGLSLYLYTHSPKLKNKIIWSSLCLGLFLFGFFTGFGAAAPDHCTGIGSVCVNVLSKRLSVDGLETSLAGLGLLLALFSSAWLSHLSSRISEMIYWLIFGAYFVAGSLLVHEVSLNQNVHSIEQIYLMICGVGLISIGLNIDKVRKVFPLKENRLKKAEAKN